MRNGVYEFVEEFRKVTTPVVKMSFHGPWLRNNSDERLQQRRYRVKGVSVPVHQRITKCRRRSTPNAKGPVIGRQEVEYLRLKCMKKRKSDYHNR